MKSLQKKEIEYLNELMNSVKYRVSYINIFSQFFIKYLLLSDIDVKEILNIGFNGRERVTLSAVISDDLITYLNDGNKNAIYNRIEKFFNQKKKSNDQLNSRQLNTSENIILEKHVLGVLSAKWNIQIRRGFYVINKHIPFLSLQCDGIGIVTNKPEFVIEIKCPQPLKMVSAKQFFKRQDKLKNNCIIFNGQGYELDKTSRHYLQIQLLLATINLKYGFMVFYSKYANDYLLIKVEKNDNYIEGLLLNIEYIYNEFVINKLRNKYNV